MTTIDEWIASAIVDLRANGVEPTEIVAHPSQRGGFAPVVGLKVRLDPECPPDKVIVQ